MKPYSILLTGLLALVLQTAVAGSTEDYETEQARIHAQLDAGAITELDAARELADLSVRLFPNDYRLQSLRNYKVLLANRLERGEIRRDEYDYLWKERRLQYLSQRNAAQQQAEQDAARAQAQNNAAALNIIGNSIRRTTAQTGINCVTIGATTSCN